MSAVTEAASAAPTLAPRRRSRWPYVGTFEAPRWLAVGSRKASSTSRHRSMRRARIASTTRASVLRNQPLSASRRVRTPRSNINATSPVSGPIPSIANPAPTVGFQYGYVEAELRTTDYLVPLGFALRFIAGVGNDGFGAGVAGRIRIGDADRTNLSGSASGVAELGFVTDLRLETWPSLKVPVGISVGVTDQPGGGDLGVRLATDLGWQARRWVRPTVRLSWQGRTATHAGLGGGLGLVFDW